MQCGLKIIIDNLKIEDIRTTHKIVKYTRIYIKMYFLAINHPAKTPDICKLIKNEHIYWCCRAAQAQLYIVKAHANNNSSIYKKNKILPIPEIAQKNNNKNANNAFTPKHLFLSTSGRCAALRRPCHQCLSIFYGSTLWANVHQKSVL